MRVVLTFALPVIASLAACGVTLSPAEREVDVVARFVEVQRCDGRYHLSRSVPPRRSSLAPQLYAARYVVDECGRQRTLSLQCNEGPRVADQMVEGASPRCVPLEEPAIDVGVPSVFAPELVALIDRMRSVFPCTIGAFELTRAGNFGSADFVVRACEQERRFHVECETFDAKEASKRCRVVDR
jgi:hypothetical protein